MADKSDRRFVRVNDQVLLSISPVSGANDHKEKSEESPARKLNKLGSQIDMLMMHVKNRHRDVGSILAAINKKVDILAELVLDMAAASEEAVLTDVNLSACGIAFLVDDNHAKGEKLQISLTLKPSMIHVEALGEVVRCAVPKNSRSGKKLLCIDFVEISEDDQEVLVQHVIRRQAQLLREAREARDNAR